MTTRIPIGGFVIKADTGGGRVYGKPKMSLDKRLERDVEGIPDPKHAGTFDQALRGLLGLVLHESAAQSLAEIRQLVRDHHQTVNDLMEGK